MIVLIMFMLKTTSDRKNRQRIIEKYFITSTFYKQAPLNFEWQQHQNHQKQT